MKENFKNIFKKGAMVGAGVAVGLGANAQENKTVEQVFSGDVNTVEASVDMNQTNETENADFMKEFNKLKLENDSLKNEIEKIKNPEGKKETQIFSKDILISGGYNDMTKTFYDRLPDSLIIPDSFVKVTTAGTKIRDLVEGYTPFQTEEAFGKAAELLENNKEGSVWFNDGADLYSIVVWPNNPVLPVNVIKLLPSSNENFKLTGASFFKE